MYEIDVKFRQDSNLVTVFPPKSMSIHGFWTFPSSILTTVVILPENNMFIL